MNKTMVGLIAGGLVGAAGIGAAFADKNTRQRVMKSGSKLANKAGNVADDVKNMI